MVPEALTFKERRLTLPAGDARAPNARVRNPALSDPTLPSPGPSLRKFLCGNPLGDYCGFRLKAMQQVAGVPMCPPPKSCALRASEI